MTKEEKAKARAQAREDYLDGKSYRQIAARYGISVGLVAKWAKLDEWEAEHIGLAREEEREQQRSRKQGKEREREQGCSQPEADPDAPQEATQEQTAQPGTEEDPVDFDLLRESAMMLLARINQRLRAEKPLEPRDIKSLTGALLDLKNQMNALSPRELREQALRLQALRKQAQEDDKPQEPVQVVFVNREWEYTPSAADAAAPSEREPGKPEGGAYAEA